MVTDADNNARHHSTTTRVTYRQRKNCWCVFMWPPCHKFRWFAEWVIRNSISWRMMCVCGHVCTYARVCECVIADTNVLSFKALLSTKATSSEHYSRHSFSHRWNVYLCICRDRVQLSVYTQCLASVHVNLHRIPAARQKTATQRCDKFCLNVWCGWFCFVHFSVWVEEWSGSV